ncbi:hypothetical protein [Bacillus cereus]|uniref:hypothetical protein n=1 Tax=Bacillus cereus TaxID=1396 RepID=UPI000BFBD394|nr:hypothetical protein [Bacillus cereus]PGY12025.1 hypothetical protein COE23_18755 [Bacillus cereus]
MSNSILHNLDGKRWEELCTKFYRNRYQGIGFHEVPAMYRGDHGIEGYTLSGIVYQCYFPEKNYSDDDLYKKQRKKVYEDIEKLIKNGKELANIGVPPVKEWHLVIPCYKDRRILEYCTKKKVKVVQAIQNKDLTHIDKDFKILIKVEDDFYEEMRKLIPLENDFKYHFAQRHTGEINWEGCQTDKVENIKRKLIAIIESQGAKNYDEQLNRMLSIYMSFYIKGIEVLNTIRGKDPALYEKIQSMSQTFKLDAQNRCDMNFNSSINKDLFEEIVTDFGNKLNSTLGEIITIESVAELKNDIISSWLADCPMDFR